MTIRALIAALSAEARRLGSAVAGRLPGVPEAGPARLPIPIPVRAAPRPGPGWQPRGRRS